MLYWESFPQWVFPAFIPDNGRASSCISDTVHAFTQLENYSPKQMTPMDRWMKVDFLLSLEDLYNFGLLTING